MRLLTLLFAVFFSCAAHAAPGDESFQSTLQRSAPAHPSQYSFADLYRLTVSGSTAAVFPVPAAGDAVRIATAQAPAQFFVAEAAEPKLGLLLLAGLAAAVWVARRRLGYAF
jgi:hypothetical protein